MSYNDSRFSADRREADSRPCPGGKHGLKLRDNHREVYCVNCGFSARPDVRTLAMDPGFSGLHKVMTDAFYRMERDWYIEQLES